MEARTAQWFSAGLWAGWLGVWVLAGVGNFSLHYGIQTSSGTHPASYPMGIRNSFPRGKAAGGVKLISHLHLVPRSRMLGATPPLPQ